MNEWTPILVRDVIQNPSADIFEVSNRSGRWHRALIELPSGDFLDRPIFWRPTENQFLAEISSFESHPDSEFEPIYQTIPLWIDEIDTARRLLTQAPLSHPAALEKQLRFLYHFNQLPGRESRLADPVRKSLREILKISRAGYSLANVALLVLHLKFGRIESSSKHQDRLAQTIQYLRSERYFIDVPDIRFQPFRHDLSRYVPKLRLPRSVNTRS
ncbi:hypothetical protein [Albimonas donghaensis]|nr:hypothetical protein [Albimonas donghaensis]